MTGMLTSLVGTLLFSHLISGFSSFAILNSSFCVQMPDQVLTILILNSMIFFKCLAILDEGCDDIVVQDGHKPGKLSVISSCGS
jgi:hypothetical protein